MIVRHEPPNIYLHAILDGMCNHSNTNHTASFKLFDAFFNGTDVCQGVRIILIDHSVQLSDHEN
jgi:hypothetical protein